MSDTTAIEMDVAGRAVEFQTFGDWVSGIDAKSILGGQTYMILPDLQDVGTVVDIGANVGATSVYFACHYPGADVYAFEPAPRTFEMLERNVRGFPNIAAHNFGLGDATEQVDLFRGAVGPGQASVRRGPQVTGHSDRVAIRDAGEWLAETGVSAIDLLKIDTEGCEVPILRSLGPALSRVRVLYAEFHSSDDRREMHELLAPTHTLATASQLFDVGEVLYLRHDEVESLRGCIIAASLMPLVDT